jgi:hypothetical protein
MNAEKFDNKDLEQIFARLDYLEERIAKLETNKELSGQEQNHHRNGTDAEDSGFVNVNLSLSAPFEANLGEYGLAWLGNIVLFFAIAFLWQYFNNAGKPLISLIVGLISAVAVFSLSQYFRKTYTYLSFTFNLFGFVILYYILLRLHYYSNNPLVPNQTVAVWVCHEETFPDNGRAGFYTGPDHCIYWLPQAGIHADLDRNHRIGPVFVLEIQLVESDDFKLVPGIPRQFDLVAQKSGFTG